MHLQEVWNLMKTTSTMKKDENIVLFAKLNTLKLLMWRHLFMLCFMRKSLSVLIDKQPSLFTDDKINKSLKQMSWQYWYDFFDLINWILSAINLCNKMHFEITEYHDLFIKLWHSQVWEQSIQTMSDDNTYINQHKLLISDNIVWFQMIESIIKSHITFIDHDYHDNVLKNILFTVQTMINDQHFYLQDLNQLSIHDDNKLFILKDIVLELSSSAVQYIMNIHMNWKYDKDVLNDIVYSDDQYYIRRMINIKNYSIQSLQQTHAICEELKIAHFDQDHLIQIFISSTVCSLPLILFVDDFDIHRNMYQAFKAFYWISVCLSYNEQHKIVNVFILFLELHRVNINDVVEVFIKSVQKLDEKHHLNINEINTLVCIFTMMLIKNMLQQADNSEFLCHSIRMRCWTCFCFSDQCEDLFYNIIHNEWYHFFTMKLWLTAEALNEMNQIQFLQTHKLQLKELFIAKLISSLNLI